MVARRGNSRDFPENTLAALRSAIALGARFIEIDVHLSSDGVPMVVHDRQLARVADFAEMSAAQLGSLDISQPDRFGERFRGSRIASLASTLDVRGPWRWAIYEVDALDPVLDLAARGADFVVTRDVRTLSEAMRAHTTANVLARAETAKASIRRS
jgi:glycerophosphoryl diester phosphodiesterase